jgi:hypothetical protein
VGISGDWKVIRAEVVNVVMTILAPSNMANFLTGWGAVSFLRTLLYEINKYSTAKYVSVDCPWSTSQLRLALPLLMFVLVLVK